jgi:hypothetical protein
MIKLSMLREKKIGRLMEVARYDEGYEKVDGYGGKAHHPRDATSL